MRFILFTLIYVNFSSHASDSESFINELSLLNTDQIEISNDDKLFDDIQKKIMSAAPKIKLYEALGDFNMCGLNSGYPQVEKFYTLSFEKNIETWTPLFANYRNSSVWRIEL